MADLLPHNLDSGFDDFFPHKVRPSKEVGCASVMSVVSHMQTSKGEVLRDPIPFSSQPFILSGVCPDNGVGFVAFYPIDEADVVAHVTRVENRYAFAFGRGEEAAVSGGMP